MPERPDALLHEFVQQGFDALAAGQRRKAVTICRQVLARRPNMARAHYLAALIALASEDRGTATRALEQAVSLNPELAAAWAQLARVRLMEGAFVAAEECLRNAVNAEHGNAGTRDLIGTVFRLAGNLAASRAWHEKAVAAAPSQVSFRINLANSQLYVGDVDAAVETLRGCLQDQPRNPQLHWLLSNAVTATDDTHLNAMRELAASDLQPRATAWLQYAIGKELEDLERWDDAFAAFDAGAAARRTTVDFDEAAEAEVYSTAARVFDDAWLAQADSGVPDAAPIFILGEPRTGSTLLERMLAAHSKVTSAGELRHFGFAVRKAGAIDEPRQFSPALIRLAARTDAGAIASAYLGSTAPLRDATPHFVDKLPTNVVWLPLILAALPRARVLLVERAPVDNCLAMYKQLFADAYLFSYTQEETARHHARYRELARTWKARFGDRFLTVRYEDLVTAPEATMRDVLGFAGLSWQEACCDPAASRGAVATASAVQVRQPAHRRSVGRWRRYERQLAPTCRILAELGVELDGHTDAGDR